MRARHYELEQVEESIYHGCEEFLADVRLLYRFGCHKYPGFPATGPYGR